jgi:hypothetical protein
MSNLNPQQFDTFYHRTSPDVAERILKEGRLRPDSHEDAVFVSNQLQGKAKAFGKSVIEVQVPKRANRTDYSHNAAKGEKWWGISPRDVKVVRGWSEIGKK